MKNTNSTQKNRRSTMTKPKFSHQDDWVLHVIVIISILIDILIDALKCLTSLNSASSTHALGKNVSHSSVTSCTASGKDKNQPPSQSTTPICVTDDQKKVAGTTTKVIPSKPSASSPRSKQSAPISNTQKSMRSGTSQALGFQQRSQPSKSTSATTSLSNIPNDDPTTADDSSR